MNSRHDISDDDTEVFNHLEKLKDDYRARSEDLENAWIVTPFDVNFENVNMNPELEFELFELRVNIAVKALFENRNFEPD